MAQPTGKITWGEAYPDCIRCGVVAAKPPICDACARQADFLAVEHFIRERGLERRRWELERSPGDEGPRPRVHRASSTSRRPGGARGRPNLRISPRPRRHRQRQRNRWLATLESSRLRTRRRRPVRCGAGAASASLASRSASDVKGVFENGLAPHPPVHRARSTNHEGWLQISARASRALRPVQPGRCSANTHALYSLSSVVACAATAQPGPHPRSRIGRRVKLLDIPRRRTRQAALNMPHTSTAPSR